MLSLGPVAFAAPWLLLALPALPILWWLLRVTPPAPRRIAFPALRLLRDLPIARGDAGPHALVAAAAAHRRRRPADPRPGAAGAGPRRPARGRRRACCCWWWMTAGPPPPTGRPAWPPPAAALDRAGPRGPPRRPAAHRARPRPASRPASSARCRPRTCAPGSPRCGRSPGRPTAPRRWPPSGLARRQSRRASTLLCVSDGLEHGAEATAGPFPRRLAAAGGRSPSPGPRPARSACCRRRVAEADRLRLRVQQAPLPHRDRGGGAGPHRRRPRARPASVAIPRRRGGGRGGAGTAGRDPQPGRAAGDRGRDRAPAASVLLDERFRRRPVGLLPARRRRGRRAADRRPLLPRPRAGPLRELRRGPLDKLLARPIAVLALADRPVAEGAEREALTRWVERGGTLIRFAGPRVAERPDPLLPVPLRAGTPARRRRCPGSSRSASRPSPRTRPSSACAVAGGGDGGAPGAGRALRRG